MNGRTLKTKFLVPAIALLCACSGTKSEEIDAVCYIDTMPKEEYYCDSVTVMKWRISSEKMDSLIALEYAFQEVESGFNPEAVNKKSNATGLYQITPIMVKEFNKRTGRHLTLEMMKDEDIATAVFDYMMLSDNYSLDVKKACRIWNKRHSREYYERINNLFKENVND